MVFDQFTFLDTQKRVEKRTRNGLFFVNLEVFGYVVKHGLQCLMYLHN